jgi:uncharacterized protein YbgA (DUF1722 family)
MGVPREPIRLVGDPAAPRLVAQRSGRDWTAAMAAFAARRVAELAALDLSGYVTKKGSPSCGMERVPVHRGKGGPPRRDGAGAFLAVLAARMPLLPVEEEGRLQDARLRESFIERIFAYARWKAALAAGMTRGALVRFHTVHKLALLAHSPDAYRRLGRVVASLGKGSVARQVDAYGAGFLAALKVPATRGRHVNVLQHVLGYLREAVDAGERAELEELVKDYQRGLVPLVVPLTLVRHHVRRHRIAWLLDQTWLDPDPKELMLRNHV